MRLVIRGVRHASPQRIVQWRHLDALPAGDTSRPRPLTSDLPPVALPTVVGGGEHSNNSRSPGRERRPTTTMGSN